jgi:hypothetical protein
MYFTSVTWAFVLISQKHMLKIAISLKGEVLENIKGLKQLLSLELNQE